MRREAVYRLWTTVVAIAACASGLVLWQHGERLVGGFGLVTSLIHALWAIDVRALVRGRWQRRPIVIPQLRHRTDAVGVRRDGVKHG